MSIESLDDLFMHALKDILYAERRILKTLPKMERRATHAGLKSAFASHLEETENHVLRLDEIFEILGKRASDTKCDAMLGLIEEGEGLMADISDPDAMDAALIGLAQAVEHYEIARYGSLTAWAAQLGRVEIAALLQATLEEEYAANDALSKLADERLKAAAGSDWHVGFRRNSS